MRPSPCFLVFRSHLVMSYVLCTWLIGVLASLDAALISSDLNASQRYLADLVIRFLGS